MPAGSDTYPCDVRHAPYRCWQSLSRCRRCPPPVVTSIPPVAFDWEVWRCLRIFHHYPAAAAAAAVADDGERLRQQSWDRPP